MTQVERGSATGRDGARGATQPRGWRTGRGELSMVPDASFQSYYGHPVIKAPVWHPEIAHYLFTGGLAGASAMLASAARGQGNDQLARNALLVSFGAVSVSPILLIKDLGMPHRFYNMLRVVKPTSPMSIGSWVLSGSGTATGVAAACEVLGILPRVRTSAEATAAALGPALATYTAALVANTAVPVWHSARYELPFVFAGGAATSAGAAAALVTPPSRAGLARTVALGGAVTELTATVVMERRLGELAEPYHQGRAGTFAKLAKGLTAAGAATVAVGGRWRPAAMLGSAALLGGALAERWAVFSAGVASARDPRYTVAPQRERLDERGGRPSHP